jgi:hypothetical protein
MTAHSATLSAAARQPAAGLDCSVQIEFEISNHLALEVRTKTLANGQNTQGWLASLNMPSFSFFFDPAAPPRISKFYLNPAGDE